MRILSEKEKQSQLDSLARDVLKLSRNTLLVNLRFLGMALSQFDYVPKKGTISTDGEHIFYDARYVLQAYKEKKERVVREYLHMVMHCIFRHNFIHVILVEHDFWNLACDIAVENAINELSLKTADDGRTMQQMLMIHELKQHVKYLTAEKLYRYFLDKKLTHERVEGLHKIFSSDDHSNWYDVTLQIDINIRKTTVGFAGNGRSGNNAGDGQSKSNAGDGLLKSAYRSRAELEESWKKISERMQVDLETFQKFQGDTPGEMIQNLREVNREKYDYASFLRQFAVMGEVMKINDEEFDYNFYTYGLKLYENMPLIEPLEYKDVKRIREFVIAVDTSGSVMGDVVQRFIQKTYNILKQEESYFKKFNLHIIQCDADIQEDTKITSQEEFDSFLKNMQIKGLGGTDFRPVFEYVEKLRKEKRIYQPERIDLFYRRFWNLSGTDAGL